MKKITVVIALIMPMLANAQEIVNDSIRWIKNLSWREVQQQAAIENKFIFVDCYATWCAPCKLMDKDVYTSPKVASLINANFIAIKLQMDTSSKDVSEIRRSYKDARIVRESYKVDGFPTFLFFNPKGTLVHRDMGFKDVSEFVELAKDALNESKQIYSLIKQYQAGKREYVLYPMLIQALKKSKNDSLARSIASDYLYNHLYKQPVSKWITKDNIKVITFLGFKAKDSIYNALLKHSKAVDSVMESPGFMKMVSDRVLYLDLVRPKVENIRISDPVNWRSLHKKVRSYSDKETADRIILNAKLSVFRKRKDWNNVVKLEIQKVERYGLDTADFGAAFTNNMIYEVIFKHAEKREDLSKGLTWIRIIHSAHPEDDSVLDTYANLLYKLGNVEEALKLEEKAVRLSDNDPEIVENFNKMKKGQKTW